MQCPKSRVIPATLKRVTTFSVYLLHTVIMENKCKRLGLHKGHRVTITWSTVATGNFFTNTKHFDHDKMAKFSYNIYQVMLVSHLGREGGREGGRGEGGGGGRGGGEGGREGRDTKWEEEERETEMYYISPKFGSFVTTKLVNSILVK